MISSRGLLFLFSGLLLLAGAAAAETTIYDIQLGNYPVGSTVTIEQVVVTAQGRFGFFAQEPDPHPIYGRQYSGIWIYTNSPPTAFVRGDLVNVTGVYTEYNSKSELDCTLPGTRYYEVGTAPVPEPVPVTIPEINNTGIYSEAYEGVLVRVDREDNSLWSGNFIGSYGWRLKRSQTPDQNWQHMYQYSAGADFTYDRPDSGTALTFAQGILDQFRTSYELCPRDCDGDLGMPCRPRLKGAYATSAYGFAVQFGVPLDEATAENVANYQLDSGLTIYSATLDHTFGDRRVLLTTEFMGHGEQDLVTVSGVRSADGILMSGPESAAFRTGFTPIRTIQYVADPGASDLSALVGEVVTVKARISALEGSNYYYLYDDNGQDWDGIYCRVARPVSAKVGDEVIVAGQVSEFCGQPSCPNGAMTQIVFKQGVDYFAFAGNNQTPVANALHTTDLRMRDAGRTAEKWEGCLVSLSSARLDSVAGVASPYYGEWLLFQQGYPDTSFADINELVNDSDPPTGYAACVGDIVDLTGVVEFSFSKYKVLPRTGRGLDIQVIYDNPACEPTGVTDAALSAPRALDSQPNPSNLRTTVRFELPAEQEMALEVHDAAGRLVRVLHAKGLLGAGTHQIVWDGKNDKGQPVGAGTYFARLRTAQGDVAHKIVILK